MTWTTQPRSKRGPLPAITAGAGPKIMMIHGVGLRAEAWGGQMAELSAIGAVAAVDMPGHGQSARITGGSQLADFTDVFAQAIEEPTIVIGHSFGAMIALDLAVRYPEKARAVAALNAIHQRDGSAKSAVMARAAGLDGMTVADPTGPLDRWFGSAASAARDACNRWLRDVDAAGYRDAYRVFAQQDGPSDADLRNLHCPALFLTGADEPNSTPEMSRRMAALAPLGRSEIMEGAAHMLPMTHADRVNAILKSFIKEVAQ